MSVFNVQIIPFDRLTMPDCYAALAVRCAVFVVGQGITSVPDVDGLDPSCDHVLLHVDGRVVGTARLLEVHIDAAEDTVRRGRAAPTRRRFIKVGRLAVLPEYRGHGYGRVIMEAVHAYLIERGMPGRMHAQAYLEGWYAGLGWRRVGEGFEEAGIAHVTMVYDPPG